MTVPSVLTAAIKLLDTYMDVLGSNSKHRERAQRLNEGPVKATIRYGALREDGKRSVHIRIRRDKAPR